jgi:predicted acetyltransferase
VFVKRGSELSGVDTVWDLSEFFVVRRYRRRGIGTQVAHEVWKRFPETWEVRVMHSNTSARHFWARAIQMFTGEVVHSDSVHKGDECWQLFSFESARCV